MVLLNFHCGVFRKLNNIQLNIILILQLSDTDLLSITYQEDLSDLQQLHEILYSDSIDVNSLKSLLEDLKKKYPAKEIDHQLILAFSLDYSRIPILVPFLSNKSMKSVDFIHAD